MNFKVQQGNKMILSLNICYVLRYVFSHGQTHNDTKMVGVPIQVYAALNGQNLIIKHT